VTGTALEINDLSISLTKRGTSVTPVSDVSLELGAGECLGLVGESGCGKSLTLRSIVGLLPRGAATKGQIRIASHDGTLQPFRPADVRGHGVSMVFQEPMTALNPTMRVGDIIATGARTNLGLSKRDARQRAIGLMREVGIPDPQQRARAWPHQLSGGLRQRVMIAMALASEPKVLLCDEPTTALDVTIQDQILGLLNRIRSERGLSIIFVTHDLAVVREICDRVSVMYAGQIVESGDVQTVFSTPMHPYTLGLLRSVPSLHIPVPLESIGGAPPDPAAFPSGCRFHPRCRFVRDDCPTLPYRLIASEENHPTACPHHSAIREIQRVSA
jgi:oligopeptide/dipeptide ABC transporter ATP-binding protein